MLYNESTGKPKVQADVFSLESLIAWLETMPAGRQYDYHCMGACLLGLWAKSIDPRSYPPREWTFGAALTRARAALR